MSKSETPSKIDVAKYEHDLLPVEAASETDAVDTLIGAPLKEGHNTISRHRSGLELMVRAKTGSVLEYVIVDAQGNPVDQITSQLRTEPARKRPAGNVELTPVVTGIVGRFRARIS